MKKIVSSIRLILLGLILVLMTNQIAGQEVSDKLLEPDKAGQEEEVNSWEEFKAALENPNISIINVEKDIMTDEFGPSGTKITKKGISRRIIIQGLTGRGRAKKKIDFGQGAIELSQETYKNDSPWHIVFKDIDLLHASEKGPIYLDFSKNQAKGNKIVFSNLTSIGGPLVVDKNNHIDVYIHGEVIDKRLDSYESLEEYHYPRWKKNDSWRLNNRAENESNIIARSFIVLEGASYTGKNFDLSKEGDKLRATNGGILLINSRGENESNAKIEIRDGAKLDIHSIGGPGEARGRSIYINEGNFIVGSQAQVDINKENTNANSVPLYIEGNGNLILGANSNFNVYTRSNSEAGIKITGRGDIGVASQANLVINPLIGNIDRGITMKEGTFKLADKAFVYIAPKSQGYDPVSNSDFEKGNFFNSALTIEQDGDMLVGKNSKIIMAVAKDGVLIADVNSAIRIGGKAGINLGEGSEMRLFASNRGHALINLGGESDIELACLAKMKINSNNETLNAIKTGGPTNIRIGERAALDIDMLEKGGKAIFINSKRNDLSRISLLESASLIINKGINNNSLESAIEIGGNAEISLDNKANLDVSTSRPSNASIIAIGGQASIKIGNKEEGLLKPEDVTNFSIKAYNRSGAGIQMDEGKIDLADNVNFDITMQTEVARAGIYIEKIGEFKTGKNNKIKIELVGVKDKNDEKDDAKPLANGIRFLSGIIDLGDNSVMDVLIGGRGYNGIYMGSASGHVTNLIVGKDSSLTIDTQDGDSRALVLGENTLGIPRNKESKFIINEGGLVRISSRRTIAGFEASPVRIGANGLIDIKDKAELYITGINRRPSDSILLSFSNDGKLRVGKDAVLDLRDEIAINYPLLRMTGNGRVEVDNVKYINIQKTFNMPRGDLISLWGEFKGVNDTNSHIIRQWTSGNLSEKADYEWKIKGFRTSYNGHKRLSVAGESLVEDNQVDYNNNFNTEFAQRIYIEGINETYKASYKKANGIEGITLLSEAPSFTSEKSPGQTGGVKMPEGTSFALGKSSFTGVSIDENTGIVKWEKPDRQGNFKIPIKITYPNGNIEEVELEVTIIKAWNVL